MDPDTRFSVQLYKDEKGNTMVSFDEKTKRKDARRLEILPSALWFFHQRYINPKSVDFREQREDGVMHGEGGLEVLYYKFMKKEDFSLDGDPFLLHTVLNMILDPYVRVKIFPCFCKNADSYVSLIKFVHGYLGIPYGTEFHKTLLRSIAKSANAYITGIPTRFQPDLSMTVCRYLRFLRSIGAWFREYGDITELIEPFFRLKILSNPIPSVDLKPIERSEKYLIDLILLVAKKIKSTYFGKMNADRWLAMVQYFVSQISLIVRSTEFPEIDEDDLFPRLYEIFSPMETDNWMEAQKRVNEE